MFSDLFGNKKKEDKKEDKTDDKPVQSETEENDTNTEDSVEETNHKGAEETSESADQTKNNSKDEEPNKESDASNSENGKKEIKLGSMTFEDNNDGKGKLVEKNQKHLPKPKPEKVSKPIIVKFLSHGKKINNDFVFTGKVGEPLTKEKLPDIPGYKLPDDLKINRRLTEKEQHLNLNYLPDTVDYTIMPVTEGNQVINPKLAKKFKDVEI